MTLSERPAFMLNHLERFIRFADWVIEETERGNPDAEDWCVFVNLTVVSLLVIVAVLILWVWV